MEFNATFLTSIVSFLVFVYLMNKILYSPIQKIVLERREFIDSNLKLASDNNDKANQLSQEKENKMSEARISAHKSYVEKVDELKNSKEQKLQEIKDSAKEELAVAYSNVANISNEVKTQLKSNMNELANDIVEKVIGYRSEVQDINYDEIDRILYHEEG